MAQVCFTDADTHCTLVGHMCQSQARRSFINTPHLSVEKAFKLCEAGMLGVHRTATAKRRRSNPSTVGDMPDSTTGEPPLLQVWGACPNGVLAGSG